MDSHKKILELKKLHTWIDTEEGIVKAVNGVDLQIQEGETVCIVGESGCGKSVTALSVMHLIPAAGRIVEGEIWMGGTDITNYSREEMRTINGKEISMIFQEPMTSLNPVFTVGRQIMESVRVHTNSRKEEAWQRALEMVRLVGIPRGEEIMESYPHELSGGMRQRIMIAMALICEPKLLIADEPTTALDVTIQAQILDLMRDLKQKLGMSILMITHDLGVVAEMADQVVVMYAGKVVEKGSVLDIFQNPLHPYTQGLLKAKPVLGQKKAQNRLYSIPGQVPSPLFREENCAFSSRCEVCVSHCKEEEPMLIEVEKDHFVSCFYSTGGVT